MLIWMDLEMTGLDPEIHRIIEIATVVTDNDLNIIAEGPDLVIRATKEDLDKMEPVVQNMHSTSGLIESVLNSSVTLEEAGEKTLEFISLYAEPKSAPLAGNSIGTDRRFLAKYLPELNDYLHYRNVDVSTIKELCKRWYPEVYQNIPKKELKHRALEDIKESIYELSYYKQTIFKKNN